MKRRPRSVTLLALGVLTLAALYLTRIEAVLRHWNTLQQYALPGAACYLLASGVTWGLLLLFLGARLWQGKPRTERLARLAAGLYATHQWLERLYLRWRNIPAHNDPFWALLTLPGLAWVFWTLSRPEVKLFFGELHEQEPQD